MKFLFALLAVVGLAQGKVVQIPADSSPYGYLARSVEIGERIRQAEQTSRIVGGVAAGLGQYPYQAGLLIDIIGFEGRGICGGSLLNANRVLTAAHCWNDGVHQGWRITVALGTVRLFSDGTRIDTSAVVNHPNWSPRLVRNDVGVIYLPVSVTFSNTISPVSLPSGPELLEDFAGQQAIAAGFGLTEDGGHIRPDQYLSHVNLRVLANSVCRYGLPGVLQDTHICTSGIGGVGTCRGDSGGPLIVNRNNRHVLIGVTSFGIALGCEINFPAAYSRVTSFVQFINSHL